MIAKIMIFFVVDRFKVEKNIYFIIVLFIKKD